MSIAKNKVYSADDLKTLIDALNGAPSYLSKRFILMRLCGWTEEMIAENVKLKQEETVQMQRGDTTWR